MGDKTGISWTDATWNPVRGCSIVSKGCTNCYAMKMAHRFSGPGKPYDGLTKLTKGGPVWTGKAIAVPDMLKVPLRWKRPRRIFVNSMSDLFHDDVPDSFIDQVFAVMALAKQHTFQILTKRPERMHCYMTLWPKGMGRQHHVFSAAHQFLNAQAGKKGWTSNDPEFVRAQEALSAWPLPNVWMGVSAEDQPTFDHRVELLGKTPAAVRWVSAEPLLEQLDYGNAFDDPPDGSPFGRVDWIVIGGESGPHARQFDVQWARQTIEQCKPMKVACFIKQLGSNIAPVRAEAGSVIGRLFLNDRAGADPAEWPEDLRVQEFPA